jgi:hypothetical protein
MQYFTSAPQHSIWPTVRNPDVPSCGVRIADNSEELGTSDLFVRLIGKRLIRRETSLSEPVAAAVGTGLAAKRVGQIP